MEDSFNVYDWKQNPNPESEKDNKFNLHEWNKKRYLGELDISDEEEDDNVSATNVSGNVNIDRGGDDPKIGAELEAGVVGDRVAVQGYLDPSILFLTFLLHLRSWSFL